MKPEPLKGKANPCMKCGSVQCAYCSKDVKSAVEWLRNREVGSKLKLIDSELEKYIVFRKKDFEDMIG